MYIQIMIFRNVTLQSHEQKHSVGFQGEGENQAIRMNITQSVYKLLNSKLLVLK